MEASSNAFVRPVSVPLSGPAALAGGPGLAVRSLNRPVRGQSASGDGLLVHRRPRGGWLLAHWDVCGKGEGAAPIHAYVRDRLRALPALSPIELLDALDSDWPSERFADALIALYEPRRRRVEVAVAGRHGLMIRGRHGAVLHAGLNRGLLGLGEVAVPPAGNPFRDLPADAWLVSVSDGLVDAPRLHAAGTPARRLSALAALVESAASPEDLIADFRVLADHAEDDCSAAVLTWND